MWLFFKLCNVVNEVWNEYEHYSYLKPPRDREVTGVRSVVDLIYFAAKRKIDAASEKLIEGV